MRPKGSRNRNVKFLHQRLKEMYGEDFDPVMMAAKNAYEMNKMASFDLTEEDMEGMEVAEKIKLTDISFNRKKECVNAWEKIAQYVAPRLKAIEHSQDPENPITDLSNSELKQDIERLMEKLNGADKG